MKYMMQPLVINILASCRVILKDMRLPMIQRAISPEAMEKRTLPARKGWSTLDDNLLAILAVPQKKQILK